MANIINEPRRDSIDKWEEDKVFIGSVAMVNLEFNNFKFRILL